MGTAPRRIIARTVVTWTRSRAAASVIVKSRDGGAGARTRVTGSP
jgi:hypothetical protein